MGQRKPASSQTLEACEPYHSVPPSCRLIFRLVINLHTSSTSSRLDILHHLQQLGSLLSLLRLARDFVFGPVSLLTLSRAIATATTRRTRQQLRGVADFLGAGGVGAGQSQGGLHVLAQLLLLLAGSAGQTQRLLLFRGEGAENISVAGKHLLRKLVRCVVGSVLAHTQLALLIFTAAGDVN